MFIDKHMICVKFSFLY